MSLPSTNKFNIGDSVGFSIGGIVKEGIVHSFRYWGKGQIKMMNDIMEDAGWPERYSEEWYYDVAGKGQDHLTIIAESQLWALP